MKWWTCGPPSTQCNRGAEQFGYNLMKYPSRMKGVGIEDGTWSGGTKLFLDIGQGHELLQRQERDHIVL